MRIDRGIIVWMALLAATSLPGCGDSGGAEPELADDPAAWALDASEVEPVSKAPSARPQAARKATDPTAR